MSLAHPFRVSPGGGIATVAPGSAALAAQLAGHVLSTVPGERGLAPLFGLPDPTAIPVSPAGVQAALAVCAPELAVTAIDISANSTSGVNITATVDWNQEDD